MHARKTSRAARALFVAAVVGTLLGAGVGLVHDALAANAAFAGVAPSAPTPTCPPPASAAGTAGALAAEHGVQLAAATVIAPAHSFASQDGPADYVVALTGTDGRTSVWGLAYLDPQWVDTAYPVNVIARALDPSAAHLWIPSSGVHDHTLVTGLAAACSRLAGGAS